MNQHYTRLHPLSFALGLGLLWAIVLFVAGVLAMYTGYAQGFVSALGSLYAYYKPNWAGCFIGAIWGFIDLFVAGYLVAWLYNFFHARIGITAPIETKAVQS